MPITQGHYPNPFYEGNWKHISKIKRSIGRSKRKEESKEDERGDNEKGGGQDVSQFITPDAWLAYCDVGLVDYDFGLVYCDIGPVWSVMLVW